MTRTIGTYVGAFLLMAATPAMAQETRPATGTLEVTAIPAGGTYFMSNGSRPDFGDYTYGGALAYKITRFKNVRLQDIAFKRAREKPEKVKEFLTKKLKESLGDRYDADAFTPPYNPWDQRLCLVPDADFFEAMKADKASVVTDHIERFDATGIQLKSGKHLDADIIVTATGLKLAVAGKIPVRVDGAAVDWSQHFYYKACMFSNVPNFSVVFGYLNASWTLRADIVSEYVCRVLNHMKDAGADIATPVLEDPASLTEENIFDFSSGYIQRALHIMPKNADRMPWRLNQNYVKDRVDMRTGAIADGVLTFTKAGTIANAAATAPAELEAAE